MIPKARILEIATQQELQATTVEKDYVLGWLLFSVAKHDHLGRWVFKGGTCLKKCYFETYRFSEDLDFTVPEAEPLDEDAIASGLLEVTRWVEDTAGIRFPGDGMTVEEYQNRRGRTAYQARVTYVGPLTLPRRSLQRVKLDITLDELIADETDRRTVYHPYDDAPEAAPRALTYSVNEILAEKTRALYERSGRARDVYDLVHLSRNFRPEIDPDRAASVLREKFEFKELPEPTTDIIMARVDFDTLSVNWEHQLRHQLPVLPDAKSFFDDLRMSIGWWLDKTEVTPRPQISADPTERLLPRQHYPPRTAASADRVGLGRRVSRIPTGAGYSLFALEKIRYAARNRLCAEVGYHGVRRLVESYSLRLPKTGNTLLYVYERERGMIASGSIKAFKVEEIESVSITDIPFAPRYHVEL